MFNYVQVDKTKEYRDNYDNIFKSEKKNNNTKRPSYREVDKVEERQK